MSSRWICYANKTYAPKCEVPFFGIEELLENKAISPIEDSRFEGGFAWRVNQDCSIRISRNFGGYVILEFQAGDTFHRKAD